MTNNTENDKKKNTADVKNGDDERGSGSIKNHIKNSKAKDKFKLILQKTGELASKVLSFVKAATKDLAQEIQQINAVRKEILATAAKGTKKIELGKTFWTKISGKQKGGRV